MFSYYGSKTAIAHLYPKPKHNLIIEPFAGAAKYSLLHFEKEVILIDKYKVIIDIWKWLQQCSINDILNLPELKQGEKIRDFKLDCEEAYLFMGFVIAAGGQSPRNTASPMTTSLRPGRIKQRLKEAANNLYKIKHWQFKCTDYFDVEDKIATWYFDPIYQYGGHVYIHSNKGFDYNALRNFILTRQGQVIVCENTKADWMEFKPIKELKGAMNKTTEDIWTNEYTQYDNKQLQFF